MPRSQRYEDAVALYAAGQSIGDLAAGYAITRQAMWDVLKRRGCVFRPRERLGADNPFHRAGSGHSPRCHDITEKAIARGDLVRPEACENCGASGTMKNGRTIIQAHHADYNKPLEVNWFCQPCHHAWHKIHIAVPQSGPLQGHKRSKK